MKKKILWISRRAPYDRVAHAGGQIHNYLLKKFKKKENEDVYLISFASEDVVPFLDLEKYNIPSNIAVISSKKNVSYLLKKFFSLLFFPTILLGFDSFWYVRHAFLASLKYKRKYGSPDVVVLQWTEMVNQIIWLKKLFPNAKYVSIEEDVSFLRKKRHLDTSSFFSRPVKKILFHFFKQIEILSLNLSDLVVVNNEKDKNLIVNEVGKKDKLFVCHPYFQNMRDVERKNIGKDLLFYGAMSRFDNYQSAIWFLENVFPELEPLGFRFYVVGNSPHESLKKYNNGKNVFVTGFVDDVIPYFERSLCLVAPLVTGAGIKIKVLEAMSVGLPVLTNEIGIEGIPAKNEKDFFFCRTAVEYRDKIIELSNNKSLMTNMGEQAKLFIRTNFDYQQDAEVLYEKIRLLENADN